MQWEKNTSIIYYCKTGCYIDSMSTLAYLSELEQCKNKIIACNVPSYNNMTGQCCAVDRCSAICYCGVCYMSMSCDKIGFFGVYTYSKKV